MVVLEVCAFWPWAISSRRFGPERRPTSRADLFVCAIRCVRIPFGTFRDMNRQVFLPAALPFSNQSQIRIAAIAASMPQSTANL